MSSPSTTASSQLLLARTAEKTIREIPFDADEAASWLRTQSADGRWPDLIYDGRPGSGFKGIAHVHRTLVLAVTWANPVSALHGSAEVLTALTKALRSWVENEPPPSDWWFQHVGVPLDLHRILALVHAELPRDLLRRGALRLRSSWQQGRFVTFGLTPATGQNLVWVSQFALHSACHLGETEFGDLAASNMRSELKIAPVVLESEVGDAAYHQLGGIQEDLSFHQHGPILYTGGYGVPFATDLASYAVMLDGTRWAFAPRELSLLIDFLLVGHRWASWGAGLDIGVLGRNNTRVPSERGELRIAEACEKLIPLAPDRAEDLANFAASIRGSGPLHGHLLGNRHFYRSDWMVHRQETLYASVRMVSDRLLATEAGNGEGLNNYYLAEGATHFLRDGNDYRFVAPLWNWRQIPGATTPQEPGPIRQFLWGYGAEGLTPWAVGASDGRVGVASFRSLRDGVRVWKSYFFIDDTLVCLGADLTCGLQHEIVTTLDQRRSDAPAWIATRDGHETTLADGALIVKDPHWIWHDGLAYVSLLPGESWRVEREHRRGDWNQINTSLPSRPVEGRVFTALVQHGVHPRNLTPAYAYAVRPAPQRGPALTAGLPVALANTPAVQAAGRADGTLTQVAFNAPGRITLGDDLVLEARQPAVVILEKRADGWTLSAANPEFTIRSLVFTLSGSWSADGAEAVTAHGQTELTLACNPTRESSGRTVTCMVRRA